MVDGGLHGRSAIKAKEPDADRSTPTQDQRIIAEQLRMGGVET